VLEENSSGQLIRCGQACCLLQHDAEGPPSTCQQVMLTGAYRLHNTFEILLRPMHRSSKNSAWCRREGRPFAVAPSGAGIRRQISSAKKFTGRDVQKARGTRGPVPAAGATPRSRCERAGRRDKRGARLLRTSLSLPLPPPGHRKLRKKKNGEMLQVLYSDYRAADIN